MSELEESLNSLRMDYKAKSDEYQTEFDAATAKLDNAKRDEGRKSVELESEQKKLHDTKDALLNITTAMTKLSGGYGENQHRRYEAYFWQPQQLLL